MVVYILIVQQDWHRVICYLAGNDMSIDFNLISMKCMRGLPYQLSHLVCEKGDIHGLEWLVGSLDPFVNRSRLAPYIRSIRRCFFQCIFFRFRVVLFFIHCICIMCNLIPIVLVPHGNGGISNKIRSSFDQDSNLRHSHTSTAVYSNFNYWLGLCQMIVLFL